MHPKRQRFTAHTELGTGVGDVREGEAEGQVSGDTWPSFFWVLVPAWTEQGGSGGQNRKPAWRLTLLVRYRRWRSRKKDGLFSSTMQARLHVRIQGSVGRKSGLLRDSLRASARSAAAAADSVRGVKDGGGTGPMTGGGVGLLACGCGLCGRVGCVGV